MSAIIENKRLRDLDWFLMLLAVGIVFFGTWQIHNAQPEVGYLEEAVDRPRRLARRDAHRRVHRLSQAGAFRAGVLHFWPRLLALVLVPGIGHKVNWSAGVDINSGPRHVQHVGVRLRLPTALMLARYFGKSRPSVLRWARCSRGVILALPVGLILWDLTRGKPSLLSLTRRVLFLSSIRMRLVVARLLRRWGGGYCSCLVLRRRQERGIKATSRSASTSFLTRRTPTGVASVITVAIMLTVVNGRLTGARTASDNTQSRLKFLPEPHTDFIFA